MWSRGIRGSLFPNENVKIVTKKDYFVETENVGPQMSNNPLNISQKQF